VGFPNGAFELLRSLRFRKLLEREIFERILSRRSIKFPGREFLIDFRRGIEEVARTGNFS